MLKNVLRTFGGAFVSTVIILSFQNCGPGKLSGSDSAGNSSMASTAVGTIMDVNALLKAANENPSNVLYPAPAAGTTGYAVGTPILQNIVLLKNDFNEILWVSAATGKVVSVDDSLIPQTPYSASSKGNYLVVGYRGSVPYLISQIQIGDKGATSLGVNSGGAVQVYSTTVASDGQNESILVQLDSPYVDYRSIDFTINERGQTLSGKRAILVTKKLSESLNLNINLTDVNGGTATKSLNLPAKVVATPTPTATPPPTPTPVMTPTPAPTPTPVMTPTPVPFTITSAPSVSNVTQTSATITWSTSVVSQGQIQYGLTAAYGSLSNKELSFNYSTHMQTISNLTPNTTYNFRVVSSNQSGASATSGNYTFKTQAPPAAVHSCSVALEQDNRSSNIVCPAGQVVRTVVFAGWGNSYGNCGDFHVGTCNDPNSMDIVKNICLGQSTCIVGANNGVFSDACPGTEKSLVIDVICGP
jgi:hypothetical protein